MIHKRRFSKTSLTNIIILVNIIIFFIAMTILAFDSNLINCIAIQPSNILSGISLWTIITSMFMHSGFLHLFVNMFSLFFLGNLTERIIGRKRFLWFYLISGIFAGLFFVLFAYLGTFLPGTFGDRLFGGLADSAVGASGALFGLLGILAIIIPRQRVYLILGPILIIILQIIVSQFAPEPFNSIFVIITSIIILLMILAMFSPNPKLRKLSLPAGMPLWFAPIAAILPLFLISLLVKLPIGNTAHLGGLIAGLAYGFYLKHKYKKKIEMLQRFFR